MYLIGNDGNYIELKPAFDPQVFSYTAVATHGQDEVTIGVAAMSTTSEVTTTKVAAAAAGGRRRAGLLRRSILASSTTKSFTLAYGANTFLTQVRAANGVSKGYTVALTRLTKVDDAYLVAVVCVARPRAAVPSPDVGFHSRDSLVRPRVLVTLTFIVEQDRGSFGERRIGVARHQDNDRGDSRDSGGGCDF